MKNILSTLRVTNLFKPKTPQKIPHASNYANLVEECQGSTVSYYNLNYNQERDMKKDDFCCIDAESLRGVVFVFGEGLKIEGSNETHNFGPFEDGFGFSGIYAKVTATVDTKARFFTESIGLSEVSTIEGEFIPMSTEMVSVIVMKSDWEQTLTSHGTIEKTSAAFYSEVANIINPLTSDVKVTPGDKSFANAIFNSEEGRDITINKPQNVNSDLVSVSAIPGSIEELLLSFEVTTDVAVKAVKTPDYYPEMVVLAEQNKIYYRGMDEFNDFEANKGLSPGAIAGIVIACVVVVGVIVFCIVWFVVLKKGCCCKSQKVAAASD